MITAAGAGSGLDIESIISQLMVLEQQPLDQLNQDIADLDAELSDIGRLKSGVDSLAEVAERLGDDSEFGAWESSSSDEDVLTVSSADGRTSENHRVEVTALAVAHRVVSDPYDSALAELTPGDFTFGSGEESFTISLESGENTLSDLRRLINESIDNTTIQASILNVDDGSRLVLTALNAGTENQISAPALFSELTEASDAEFTINGLPVTAATNTITDAVPGLTIDLFATGSANIASTQNTEAVKELLEEFAASYNALRATMTSLAAGSLQGDSITRRIETSIRDQFFSSIDIGDGNEYSMFDYGFTFDETGVLSVDETRMNESIASNLGRMVSVFTSVDSGFSSQMVTMLEQFTDVDGFFDIREEAIAARENALDDQIDRFEYRLEQTEARYRRQFGAMDALVSQLQSNGDFLLQSLSASTNSS